MKCTSKLAKLAAPKGPLSFRVFYCAGGKFELSSLKQENSFNIHSARCFFLDQ